MIGYNTDVVGFRESLRPLLQPAQQSALVLGNGGATAAVIFALLFYPAALGWGAFDPYALGYQPWPLLAALVPLAGVLWWQRQDAWLIMLADNLAAYATGAFAGHAGHRTGDQNA